MVLRHWKRGVGIAGVFVLGLLLSLLVTVLVGLNTSAISVTRHSENSLVARSAAESVVAKAILELKTDVEYGSLGQGIAFEPASDFQEKARLTFDPKEAELLGLPLSVNNLSNPESIAGPDGEVIPARTARLYARGTCGNQVRTVAADLHIPPYPYAIATDGAFESKGGLTVSGVSPETGKEVPADMLSNSSSDDSIKLGPESQISGDLVSAGGIQIANEGVEVGGETRAYGQKHELPRITLSSYDPRLMAEGGGYTNLDKCLYQDPSVQGKVVSAGDLVLQGDINLDGALLFVDGNLDISGTIAGRGAIVCTKNLSITGTQRLTSDNELAILAGRNFSIRGDGVGSSHIRGLLYAEGDVLIQNSTVEGTLISQSDGCTSPSVLLDRANLRHNPEAITFTSTVTTTEFSATHFLGFKKDGKFDHKAAEKYNVDSVGMGGKDGKKKDRLFLGVTLSSDGRYLVFAPGLSEPREANDRAEALSLLAELVRAHHPQFKKKSIKWATDSKKAKKLLAQLETLVPQEGDEKTVEVQVTESTQNLDLEIDPMRFLRVGEEMRLRSMRVLETSL